MIRPLLLHYMHIMIPTSDNKKNKRPICFAVLLILPVFSLYLNISCKMFILLCNIIYVVWITIFIHSYLSLCSLADMVLQYQSCAETEATASEMPPGTQVSSISNHKSSI